jgi:hypothetical protein
MAATQVAKIIVDADVGSRPPLVPFNGVDLTFSYRSHPCRIVKTVKRFRGPDRLIEADFVTDVALMSTNNNRDTPELDPRLISMERVFRAPPLTPELVAAIKLIAPQFDLATNDKSRSFWEAEQNGDCWGEYEALKTELSSIARPAKILEVGPGMGRSLVFFSKKLGWESNEIHAYEGNGETTKYTLLGPRFEDSFCGNIPLLRQILDFNAVRNVTLFNAQDVRLPDLPGPYDLIYSFYSIGFHWALEHFLPDLLPLLHDRSIAIFTVPNQFKPFTGLAGLSFKLLVTKTAWPKDRYLNLLVLTKAKRIGWETVSFRGSPKVSGPPE